MNSQRMHARGPRGEAVIVVKTASQQEDAPAAPEYRLGTGERLVETEDPKVFQATDGRRFTLV